MGFDLRNKPILVLDEEEISLGGAVDTLSEIGFAVSVAHAPADALLMAKERAFEVILFSHPLRERSSEQFVRELREQRPDIPIVALAAPSELPGAAALFSVGLEDYALKPPLAHEIEARLGRIIERHTLDSRVSFLQDEISKRGGARAFVFRSAAMDGVVRRIDRIAPLRSTVLILGESGVGKELVARAIHFHSPRKNHAFVALNCSAIPESLIESELFGHEKGSFTGAVARAPGKFEIAHRGTLFLDEIGEMRTETQVKLLRVLEEREFMRVGGDQTVRVDVRVIAATNADIEKLVAEGRFRRDLYFRLKVVTIAVPPLRERREDIPDLVDQFLEEICRGNNLAPRRLSEEALSAFVRHHWPGNVRELKNVLESVVVNTPHLSIDIEDLPPALTDGRARLAGAPEIRTGMTMEQMERELIRRTLERAGGNRTHTARILDISIRTLQRKIRSYGLI